MDPVDPRAALGGVPGPGRAQYEHRHPIAPGVEDRHGGVHQADIGVHHCAHHLSRGLGVALGDGDGWLVILLLILVAALLSSAFGAVIYLVYSAPTILAEVAFQAMLAGGMVKSSQRWRDASWETSLFKSTWIAFVLIFVLAVGTAVLAARLFPTAHTLPDVIRTAVGTLG